MNKFMKRATDFRGSSSRRICTKRGTFGARQSAHKYTYVVCGFAAQPWILFSPQNTRKKLLTSKNKSNPP